MKVRRKAKKENKDRDREEHSTDRFEEPYKRDASPFYKSNDRTLNELH